MMPKTPLIINDSMDVPELFSLPLSQATGIEKIDQWIKVFTDQIIFINHLASGLRLTPEYAQQLGTLFEQLVDANEALDAFISAGTFNIETMLPFYVFLKLAYYSALQYAIEASNAERQEFLLAVVRPLSGMENKSDVLSWHYAYANIRLYDLSPDETRLAAAVATLRSMTSQPHKEGIYALVMSRLEHFRKKPLYYPTGTLFTLLNGSLSNRNWRHEPICASARHAYVTKHELRNTTYFDPQNSKDPKEMTTGRDLTLKINASNSIGGLDMENKEFITDGDLLKFASQLGGVTPAIPYFKIEDLTATQISAFNRELIPALFENKLATSQGFLLKNTYSDVATYKRFQQVVIDCYSKHVGVPSADFVNQLLAIINKTHIQGICKTVGAVRTRLAGMSSQKALLLYQEALKHSGPHGLPHPLRGEVQQVVHTCIETFMLARDIYQSNRSDPNKHADCFELAKKIVAHMVDKKSDLLINVGKPVIAGQESAGHAIYVALKWTGENMQIIITNGGFGADKFHKLADDAHEDDRFVFRYAAFKPFPCTDENKIALTHYMYKLLSMRYVKTADMDDTGPSGFYNVYGNIYLKNGSNGEYFDGYRGEICNQFVREDLNESYLSQFHGNCTLHNLSRGLKILLNMDELMFGLLEDNVLIGIDDYMSNCNVASAAQTTRSTLTP